MASNGAGPAVHLRELVLAYGAEVALERSTLDIPAGRLTAVIGPNGSGKTTLLNALAGLLRPASGELELVSDYDTPPRVSYVLQATRINEALPITVREVVAMGRYATVGPYRWLRRKDRSAIDDAMRRTGIGALAGRPIHRLSGGERQRVMVAQGLAQDHDILLLDEPLIGIDLPTARAIDQVVHTEREHGCTVVMTTHNLTEARAADNVILLSRRVVASGTPATVLTVEHLTAAYGASAIHPDHQSVFIDDAAHHHGPSEADRHVDRHVH